MPIEVLTPRRLYRQIADQLRQLIDDGEYAVGSRLPTERELAEKLGVSRPTVREALIALEVEGRLRIKVGSGIYVIEQQPAATPPLPDPVAGPFELLSARAFVESAVAEEAARVAGPEDVARLDALLNEAEGTPLSCDAWITLDRQFHIGLVTMLGNAVLVRCVGDLFDQRINPYYARLAQHFENPATWRTAHEEHRAVRDAIAGHYPQRARAAMRVHLERSHERFCRDFGEAPDRRHGTPDAERRARARQALGKVARVQPQTGTARIGRKVT
ncbi:MAG: FadR family transcriptional regulator [Hyphomicrobiaceae bacterium]|nr:FadR family transcriptional regulator [Hyphomicrobiaceae bacterium]